jgi:hypothetical protein
MDKKKYTLTLTGEGETVTVKNVTMNGNNYVSKTKVNLSSLPSVFALTATDESGNVTESIENAKLVQQVKYDWDNGNYYLAFGSVSQLDLDQKTQNSKIEYIAMMADVDLEGVE